MGWIKRVLPTAAGPGLVVLAFWLLWLAYDAAGETRGSALLAGAGLGTATSIIALPVALAGMSLAKRWIGAIGFALAATVASRLFGLSRLEPISAEWELLATVGAFCVYLIAIAVGYGVRAAARRSPIQPE